MRLIILFIGALAANHVYAETLRKVPANFIHDRIVVTANAPDGEPITFYTDTGGGWNAIGESAANRLQLISIGIAESDGQQSPLVEYPRFLSRAGIPQPNAESWLRGGLIVGADKSTDSDGFLGSRWFAGRVWEFDYPNKTLRFGATWRPRKKDVPVALGFRKDGQGVRDLNFPRIAISIDGETFQMLLDTGATAQLTSTSSREFNLPENTKTGTSYMVNSVFEKWIVNHPDWKVIENAEGVTKRAFRMIQVPEVRIGTLTVGPVWFSERRDKDFHEYMSPNMDQPIDGAIGGSALKYCRFVIDYPNAVAYFQSPSR